MIGLAFLLIVAAVLVVAALFTYRARAAFAPQLGDEFSAPRCGRCNYIVRGVPTFTCPECGSDLREVGIVTPRAAAGRHAGPAPYVAIWTLVLILIGLPLSTALVPSLPLWRNYTTQRYIFVLDPALSVTVLANGARTGFGPRFNAAAPPRADTLTLRIQNAPARSDLVVQPTSGAYCYTDAHGAFVNCATGFGPAAIRDWLAANVPAARTGNPGIVLARATDIDTCAGEMFTPTGAGFTRLGRDAMHPLDPVTAHPTFTTTRASPLSIVLVIAAWVALWAYGVHRIRLRYGRHVGPVKPVVSTSAPVQASTPAAG